MTDDPLAALFTAEAREAFRVWLHDEIDDRLDRRVPELIDELGQIVQGELKTGAAA